MIWETSALTTVLHRLHTLHILLISMKHSSPLTTYQWIWLFYCSKQCWNHFPIKVISLLQFHICINSHCMLTITGIVYWQKNVLQMYDHSLLLYPFIELNKDIHIVLFIVCFSRRTQVYFSEKHLEFFVGGWKLINLVHKWGWKLLNLVHKYFL